MTLVVADRVLETCTAPGTGTVSLLGATTGYQSFSAAIGNANTTYYTIADQSGANWEVGIGTYSSGGNTLARTTVLASSNSNALVNFASGIQNVFVTYPAEKSVNYDAAGNVTLTGTTDVATLDIGTALTLNSASGTAGQVLTSSGVGNLPTWSSAPTIAGGSNTQVQYNSSGALAGSANLTFDGTNLTALGHVGIGTAPTTQTPLNMVNTLTGITDGVGILNIYTGDNTVTNTLTGYYSISNTSASAFTLTAMRHYFATQGTIGAGSTVTNQYGFYADTNLTGATNNYGFYSSVLAGTGRYNFYAGGTADNYFAGRVGIATLAASKNGTFAIGGTSNYGAYSEGIIYSGIFGNGVSSRADAFISYPSVNNTTGTLSLLTHFFANQNTFSTAVTTQAGFYAESGITGATNNYGFFSNIAAGTGRYNFYAAGTADNYMAGSLGVGAAPYAGVNLNVQKNITGALTAYSVSNNCVIQSDVTTSAAMYATYANTAAASFTLTTLNHFVASQGTVGAGSAITNQYGFITASNMTGATNNYGFFSQLSAGTGRYNFYANGTAANYFAGDMQLGKTVTAAGTTGAQTINKTAGTVNFAAAATSLVVTNSLVTTSSIIVCTVGTNDTTMKSVVAVAAAGSFTLFANAAATAETRVNFVVFN